MINVILTSSAAHLAPGLKKWGGNFYLIFSAKNKDGKILFPDGEVYARISRINSLKGKRVVVLHSGIPGPNDGLIELELILQILKDHKIKPEAFFAYFPYGRQDKVFETGETSAAESLVKKLIDYYKVRKIYIIDPHFGKMKWVLKYPVVNISAAPLLIEKAKKDFGRDLLLLTPDRGGKRRTGLAGLNKKRINSFEVTPFSSKIAVSGKAIGVVDDIIGTGGTLIRFYEFAEKSGAKKVIGLITHGVLDSGIQRIKKKFAKLYLANTINRREANIDITELIAGALK